jgi:hypothetical protein
VAVGSLSEPDGQAGDVVEAEQALYENGDQFIYIETAKGKNKDLPDGQAAKVAGEDAVILTGLTGTLSMEPLLPGGAKADGAAGMTVTTAAPDPAPAAGSANGPTVVTGEAGLTVSGGGNGGPSTVAGGGAAPAVSPVIYENATSLTWIMDGTWVEIISNLPVAEIIKVAEGLVPGTSE